MHNCSNDMVPCIALQMSANHHQSRLEAGLGKNAFFVVSWQVHRHCERLLLDLRQWKSLQAKIAKSVLPELH